jgi:hypothetical protein
VDSAIRTGRGPIRVVPGAADPDSSRQFSCGPLYNAALGSGAGQASTLIDAATGTKVEVLGEALGVVRVRVSRP